MANAWDRLPSRTRAEITALVLATYGHTCHLRLPGCTTEATEPDHLIPVGRGGDPTDLTNMLPACRHCNAARGARPMSAAASVAVSAAVGGPGFLDGGVSARPLAGFSLPEADSVPDSPDAADPVWDAAPWLDPLRSVPADACWPRFMTLQHPLAVGSLGASFEAWSLQRGRRLRWWQRLVAYRLLEVDAAGLLVWDELLLTTSRRVGKSILLAELALWRITHADLFGEEQTVIHTGRDIAVCQDVQRQARRWARSEGLRVMESNGKEAIEVPGDGSRWLIRSQAGVYGYPSSMPLVDEAWDVPASVVTEGLEPTIEDREQPQMLITSTAHRKATSLFLTRRRLALDELGSPGSTLLLEWSAPADSDITDAAAWRAASPHWDTRREKRISKVVDRVLRGESDAKDLDDDPVEAFRSQWLNIWPKRQAARIEKLVDPEVFTRSLGRGPGGVGALVVVMEDAFGLGQCLAVAERDGLGTIRVTAETRPSRPAAWAYIEALSSTALVERVTVLIGATLAVDPQADELPVAPEIRGSAQTRAALPLYRSLVTQGRIVHDDAPDAASMREALLSARVVQHLRTGVHLTGGQRSDIVRAVVWAVAEAAQPDADPQIG